MKLLNASKNQTVVIDQLEIADSLWSRLKGLLGRASMSHNNAMWFDNCTSIHTFFMKFSIDVVFLDRSMKVKRVYAGVKPGRLVGPVWGARSVVEMAAGKMATTTVEIGDQLNVVS